MSSVTWKMSIWQHPKTGVYYYRKAVPADLRSTLGWEIKRSLGTKDDRVAKRRYPEVAALAQRLLDGAEAPLKLCHQQIHAIAGEWCRWQHGVPKDEPGDPEQRGLEFDALAELHERSPSKAYRDWDYDVRRHHHIAPEPDIQFKDHAYRTAVADDIEAFLREEGLINEVSSQTPSCWSLSPSIKCDIEISCHKIGDPHALCTVSEVPPMGTRPGAPDAGPNDAADGHYAAASDYHRLH